MKGKSLEISEPKLHSFDLHLLPLRCPRRVGPLPGCSGVRSAISCGLGALSSVLGHQGHSPCFWQVFLLISSFHPHSFCPPRSQKLASGCIMLKASLSSAVIAAAISITMVFVGASVVGICHLRRLPGTDPTGCFVRAQAHADGVSLNFSCVKPTIVWHWSGGVCRASAGTGDLVL